MSKFSLSHLAPTILLKDFATKKHHDKCDTACGRGEVAHEGGVSIWVGVGRLKTLNIIVTRIL